MNFLLFLQQQDLMGGFLVDDKLKMISYIICIVISVLVTYLFCSVFTEPEIVVQMNGGELYYNKDGTVAQNYSEELENSIFSESADSAYLININTASKSELMDIPNVGEQTAEKIIEYREKSGFKNIEELMNVDGIGVKKFSFMKSYICVE